MSTPVQSIAPEQKPGLTTSSTPTCKPETSVFGAAETSRAPEQVFSAFGSINQFKDAQRMALMLARSSIVPENYRGDEHVADCVIVLEIANRIGASVLAVMQNLLMIEGKPSWSSQFLISCLNATKRFSPLRYQMTGTRSKDSRCCVAWALDKSGQVLKSPEVTIKMAKNEGWYDRLGSKWKTMPELMLRYRSATLFTRLYAPELTMGIQTTEELADIGFQCNGKVSRPVFIAKKSRPGFTPKSNGHFKPKSLTALPQARTMRAKPEIKQKPTKTQVSGTKPTTKNDNHLKALKGMLELSPHSETKLIKLLHQSLQLDPSVKSLAVLGEKHPDTVIWAHDHWSSLEKELSKKKEVSL